MGDKLLVEKIIQTIKKHPVLYDNTLAHACRKDLREALWEEIADTFDIDVHVLKVKWKNLRDCYKKHLRAQNEDSKAVSSYRFWHWSEALDFLRPHVRSMAAAQCDGANAGNAADHENSIDTIKLEDHTNFGSDSEVIDCIIQQPKLIHGKRASNTYGSDSDNVDSMLEQNERKKKREMYPNLKEVPCHSRTEVNELDGIELIFLGYAKTVKNMPVKRQISVKMKIAKIIMEEELKCLEQ